jgi:hypothetical protein
MTTVPVLLIALCVFALVMYLIFSATGDSPVERGPFAGSDGKQRRNP